MREHVTKKITLALLKGLGACDVGLRDIRPILPLVVSTDPEENIDLAIKIAHRQRAQSGSYDAWWLSCRLTERDAGDFPDQIREPGVLRPFVREGDTAARLFCPVAQDPYLIAQWLAVAADRIDRTQSRKRVRR